MEQCEYVLKARELATESDPTAKVYSEAYLWTEFYRQLCHAKIYWGTH